MLLQHLDLIAVRVLHEEEARHQRSALRHFFDWIGYKPFVRKPCVLSGEIIDMTYTDAAALYESPDPTWVAAPLVEWTRL